MTAAVLLPGLDGTGDLLGDFAARLSPELDARIVRYPVDEALGYPALERIARDALPGDRPFILIGESFSGPIAIRLAAARPPGLRALILCASFAESPQPLLRGLAPCMRFAPLQAIPASLLSWLLLGGWGSRSSSRTLKRTIASVSHSALKLRACEVLSVDASGDLRRIQCPILHFRATQDRLVPHRCAERIRSIARDTEVVDVEGPHFLLQAVPEDCARMIKAFLRNALL